MSVDVLLGKTLISVTGAESETRTFYKIDTAKGVDFDRV